MATNNVNITTIENSTVKDVMADVDFSIEGSPPPKLEDVIWDTVLSRIEGRVTLPEGEYNIRMLCVITKNED